ncbi:MAG TPA: glycosyltransferase family 4 protein [Candidatus Corynebacterium gallistercoris]|uniref:Glycosyltransferase family 4 protein n=1 Tax=Candidatus Corynebacterium gallistercoris TaxID=2838530 RepID=A0A9D1S1L9_9CORY|nr:glycosyltransferase family 4 protein [Candidatus Corynebacterium gallistercoris]
MRESHPKVLVVTNDFPPTLGGIQTYVRDYLTTLDPQQVVVFASTQDAGAAAQWDATQSYTVQRWHRGIMLPTPAVARRMQQLIKEHGIHTVWFAAAAPLGILAPAARAAGAQRVVASTHGHEVGWSMFPGSRQVLRRIGNSCDAVTFVSRYARNRLAHAFGPATAWEAMPGGVNVDFFAPTPDSSLVRRRHGLTDSFVIVAVSRLVPRKGQDTLVEALPEILERIPNAHLLLVGPGDFATKLSAMARRRAVAEKITMTGAVDYDELPAYYGAGDVFALPVRTQWGGLSVEGLGIVYLEAQACGVATIAGSGGGAPETVVDGETGLVVRNREELVEAIVALHDNPDMREKIAAAGVDHVRQRWTWEVLGRRARRILAGAVD